MSKTEGRGGGPIILLVTAAGSALHPLMVASLNVALPAIGREFAVDAITLSWVVTAYILASATTLVPLGKIADMHGRKRIFGWGVLIYTTSALLCGFASSMTMLLAFRVLQGIGITMVFSTSVAILASSFSARDRGRVLGINLAATYLALAVGPIVGGFITETFGWRGVFLANVPFGVILLLLLVWKLEGEWVGVSGETFDSAGSVLYGATLVALMYGISLLPSWSGAAWILGGVLGLAGFIWWENRATCPVLNLGLFRRNPLFARTNLAALVFYAATSAVPFLLSLYLQGIRGLSPQEAGWILIAQPIFMALFSPVAGRLSDRVRPAIVYSWGLVLVTSGLLMLAVIGTKTSLEWIVFGLLVLGLGYALFSSPNSNAGMSAVESRFYGVASATLSTMRLSGQMLSMGLTMLVLALFMGKVQVSADSASAFITSFTVILLCSASLSAIAIPVSLVRT